MAEQSPHPMSCRQLQVLVLAPPSAEAEPLTTALKAEGCDTYLVASLDDISSWLAAMRFDAVVVDPQFADAVVTVRQIRGDRVRPVVVAAFTLERSRPGAAERPVPLAARDVLAAMRRLLDEPEKKRPARQPVNVEKFLSLIDSDRTFFEAMSAEFLQDAVVKLPELQSAVSAGDCRRVEFLAHGLKSVLGLFGAEDAAAAARELESAGREGRADDAGRILPEFLDQMSIVDHQLRKMLEPQ